MIESIKSTVEGFTTEERKLLLYRLKSLVHEGGNTSGRKGSQRLVAYIKTNDSYQPDALQSYLKEKLPAHMIPSAVHLVDDFPYLPNGKIDKEALRRSGSQVQKSATEFNKTGSEIEQKLIEIWEDVLGFSPIVPCGQFF